MLSIGLFIAVTDNHYWTVLLQLCGSASHRQTVATRDPSKPLAEITQDNCVFVESQRAVCNDWDGGGVAWLLWVWCAHSMCVCKEEAIMRFGASGDQ